MNKMMQFIDVTGIQTCGPLITHVKGSYVTASGEVTVDQLIRVAVGIVDIGGRE